MRYLLFDLDGTLLPLDTDKFLGGYLQLIGKFFADVVEPNRFVRQLMASTQVMIGNSGQMTNQEAFIADFFPRIGHEADQLMPLFEQFYAEQFPALRAYAEPSQLSRELAQTALDKGYRIVLATNPVFPREAVQQRMEWAGVHDLPWELVTSYENSSFCKPNPAYYQEILDRLGAKPGDCLHIGNDADEDLAAQKIGLPVVLVEEYLINRHQRELDKLHFRGSLADVLEWLNK